jgi:protein DGCR14
MPTINNYALVAADPSPAPEDLPSLLTWGTLLATPKALDGSDDPLDTGRSFRLPANQRRDEIGRRLGNKASKDMNERAKGYTPRPSGSSLSSTLKAAADRSRGVRMATPGGMGQMLPPSSTPKRDHLTPAGKRLLERSLGRSPMTTSGSKVGASGRNRGAAMEVGSGWGMASGGKGKKVGEMSWTPSPGHRR